MEADTITEIAIDEKERLCIKPSSATYPMIYREAAEVHWDQGGRFLYSPKPREWSYFDWFTHILKIADPEAKELRITERTEWRSIPPELKEKIFHWMNER